MDPRNLPPHAQLSELAHTVRLVPLETKPESIMGYVGRLFVGKEYIILTSGEGTMGLFLFTIDGKFVRKIGSQGKGPGEYSGIREISVIEDSTSVFVSSSGKILEYSFEGQMRREIPVKRGLSNAKMLDANRVAYSSYYNYEVKIVDMLTQDTLYYIDITPESRSQMKHFNGTLHSGHFYTALGRDTIWRVDQDSMRPAITCDFGTGHFTSDEYFGSIFNEKGYPSGKLSIGGGTVYNQGFYHFSLLRQDAEDEFHYDHIIINEESGESWHLSGSATSDDILFCSSTDFSTANPGGEWVSAVGAYELIDALPEIKANKSFKYPDDLVEQIEKMTIGDNPVLVFYTFK